MVDGGPINHDLWLMEGPSTMMMVDAGPINHDLWLMERLLIWPAGCGSDSPTYSDIEYGIRIQQYSSPNQPFPQTAHQP